ncbi:hypothetical protein [Halobaculum litoreum]|uniref:hypothetical protein n=1 Tax=Halobaculum litoreum TaxID=3031998 RepID=UPI0024C3621A|nr:hypothetical protein [Halobaculum sp. DT92]
MGSFEFGSDDATAADDPATDPEPAADGGAAFGEPADTAVAPAEPEPLPADLDPDSRDDPSPTSGRAADADAPAPATRASVDAVDAALLYAGEEPRAELPVADGRLVATSHRVIAYAPDDDERATLRGVHRANVRAVRLSSTGTDWLARPIAYCVVGGLAMVAGGSLVSFDAMSTTMPDSAGATGVGGLLSTIGGILSMLAFVDDLLRVGGALALLAGAALMGVYAYTRGREVVVETEGEADTLRVAAADADGDAVERFRAAAGLETEDDGTLKRVFGR